MGKKFASCNKSRTTKWNKHCVSGLWVLNDPKRCRRVIGMYSDIGLGQRSAEWGGSSWKLTAAAYGVNCSVPVTSGDSVLAILVSTPELLNSWHSPLGRVL